MTQPTHDEMLAWVDNKIERRQKHIADLKKTIKGLYSGHIEHLAETSKYGGILKDNEEILASLLANRAGLERHKPIWLESNYGSDNTMSESNEECLDGCGNFPCPTYTEIYDPIVSVM